ncbi:sensor histidine kinase [Dethiobacter alkaliphilus]|uniref:sensor histidine kinase n=1 Tax=Dethiobacter alkaliphilus TaxID=427926 RepID=UPI002226EFBD|nr:ATP-binding protein [Dethiobacter alkaliphilus]MCW3490399.1 hypothetical protein [Dethiobacter alkaliphilus]
MIILSIHQGQKNKYFIVDLVFIAAFIFYFGSTFFHPYIGISVMQDDGQWVVTSVDSQGKGYKLGIQVGDTVLSVDDIDPGPYPTVKNWGEVEGVKTLEVLVSDEVIRKIEVPPRSFFQNLLYEAPLFFMSLIFWFTGFVTLAKRPFLSQAKLLYWFNTIVALAIIVAPASSRHILLGREIMAIIFSFIPAMLLKFVSVFPVKREADLFSPLTRAFMLVPFISALMLGFGNAAVYSRIILIISLTAAVILVLGYLIGLMFKLPAHGSEKSQVAIILSGLLIGSFPFILFSSVPQMLVGETFLNPRFSVMFILTIPLTFSYVIISRYLPDGRYIFKEIITFVLAAIMTGAILTGILYSTNMVLDAQLAKIIFTILLGTIVVYSVGYVVIRNLVNRAEIPVTKETHKSLEEGHSLQLLKLINRAMFFDLEEEKKVIAREIHDGPLQMGIGLSRKLKNEIGLTQNASLNELIGAVDELNFELRSICEDLRPAALSALGLVPAVESLCQQVMEECCLDISLRLESMSVKHRFSEEIEVTAYRFIQEALNNVVKHSKSDTAEVTISIKEGCLYLEVQDYGKGFEAGKLKEWAIRGKHLGLVGLQERVERASGSININTMQGKGVILSAIIPIVK